MSDPLSLEAFQRELNRRLDRLYEQRQAEAKVIDPVYAELIGELRLLITRGGKRLRPYLTYLTYLGLGGSQSNDILELAASQELLHNFLVIHDDVFDRDVMRYGGLNVAGRYRLSLPRRLTVAERHHLADALAIMGGDLTMGLGFRQIMESNFAPELKLAALKRQERMIFEVAGGEALDLLVPTFELSQVTEERLLRTYRYKTASYSFEAPMQVGAIMAGGNEAVEAAISAFALPLGVAFQLADDLLGMYGNEVQIGKSVLSDLREGKRTLLMVKGLKLATVQQRAILEAALGNHRAGYSTLGKVREVLEASGAKAYVEKLAQEEVKQALTVLDELGLSRPVQTIIERLAHFTIERHS